MASPLTLPLAKDLCFQCKPDEQSAFLDVLVSHEREVLAVVGTEYLVEEIFPSKDRAVRERCAAQKLRAHAIDKVLHYQIEQAISPQATRLFEVSPEAEIARMGRSVHNALPPQEDVENTTTGTQTPSLTNVTRDLDMSFKGAQPTTSSAKLSLKLWGNRELQQALLGLVKSSITSRVPISGVDVGRDDCGTQALDAMRDSIVPRDEYIFAEIQNQYSTLLASFNVDRTDYVEWFDKVIQAVSVVFYYANYGDAIETRGSWTRSRALTDAIRSIKGIAGSNHALSFDISVWETQHRADDTDARIRSFRTLISKFHRNLKPSASKGGKQCVYCQYNEQKELDLESCLKDPPSCGRGQAVVNNF
jgi:hypothetical protein